MNNKLLNFSLKMPIICTILLIVGKFFVYQKTGSLSIFSSFADSSLDFIGSFISLVALKYSKRESNDDYKYGYQGAIDLATIIVAFFIIATSFLIFQKSILNILNKNIIKYNKLSVYVMLFSVFLSGTLSIFLHYVYNKTNSILIKNEIAHYTSDILTNSGVLVSLLICKFYNHYLIDPTIAIIMTCISTKPAFEILKIAINNIMSKEIDEDTKNRIIGIVMKNKEVIGYHKFKTRKSGEKIFIQIDIELSMDLSFKISHDIVEKIEDNITEEIGDCEVLIHTDPR